MNNFVTNFDYLDHQLHILIHRGEYQHRILDCLNSDIVDI